MFDDIFVDALRNKYRYDFKSESKNFILTTEDLFDLGLEDLDNIYGLLDEELSKISSHKSLSKSNMSPEVDELRKKMSIVEFVYGFVEQNINDMNNAREVAQQRQRIMKLIDEKQDEDLKNKSIDELKDMLENL